MKKSIIIAILAGMLAASAVGNVYQANAGRENIVAAYNAGTVDGYNAGYENGENVGFNEGYETGYDLCYTDHQQQIESSSIPCTHPVR